MLDARIAAATVPVLATGPKPDDPAGEHDRRRRALAALGGAVTVESDVREAAVAATAARAETAIWTGASLADLAGVTGHSRQAARKRWPGLGPAARRRRWLGNHVDDVLWVADLVLTHAPDLPADVVAGFDDDVAGLRRAFAPDDGPGHDEDPAARWHALDDLVDRRLRAVAAAAVPLPEEAEFARHGADGVVRYYDQATAEQDRTESDHAG
jgi:hypothetical protein